MIILIIFMALFIICVFIAILYYSSFEYGYVRDNRDSPAKRRGDKTYIWSWEPSTIWEGHWKYKWRLDTYGYKFIPYNQSKNEEKT